jgi:sec-independent protein translocase protein TatB
MSPHPPVLLGTMSMIDSLILMVMALVVFGPRRLPQIGRQIGKLMYEFRKASNDFKFQMEEELRNSEEADRRRKEEERQRSLAALATEQSSVSADPAPATLSTESPYSGEGTYPPQYPPEIAPAEVITEGSTPVIMPPAVGETVAASRPNRGFESSSESTSEPQGVAASSSSPQESGAENPSAHHNPQPPEAAEALNPHG